MRKGFIFDSSLCVSCQSCRAACILENGFCPDIRRVYSWNSHALPPLGVINLSMACNHCADPACLTGCPAGAYTINSDGVVIHHQERCMGCGYCTWRCPFEAPSLIPSLGYVEKCHLCHTRADEGVDPACVTACPTGALRITMEESFAERLPSWLPASKLSPSLIIRDSVRYNTPDIIPAEPVMATNAAMTTSAGLVSAPSGTKGKPSGPGTGPGVMTGGDSKTHTGNAARTTAGRFAGPQDKAAAGTKGRSTGLRDDNLRHDKLRQDKLLKEWSLFLFSGLVIAASAMILLRVYGVEFRHLALPFLLMVAGVVFSLAHLGQPGRAWRALSNITRSPLSREVAMVILFTLITLVNWLTGGAVPGMVMVLAALITLIMVDDVYFGADGSRRMKLHSGQAFFTALYAGSWFATEHSLFILGTMLAAASVVMRHESLSRRGAARALYLTRAMTLPLVLLLLWPGSRTADTAAIILFLSGLLADRMLFYYDFTPPNATDSINDHFITEYEKERDKQYTDSGLS